MQFCNRIKSHTNLSRIGMQRKVATDKCPVAPYLGLRVNTCEGTKVTRSHGRNETITIQSITYGDKYTVFSRKGFSLKTKTSNTRLSLNRYRHVEPYRH